MVLTESKLISECDSSIAASPTRQKVNFSGPSSWVDEERQSPRTEQMSIID